MIPLNEKAVLAIHEPYYTIWCDRSIPNHRPHNHPSQLRIHPTSNGRSKEPLPLYESPWDYEFFSYGGTPAGLFESSDSGEHWKNANLVLIFQSNTRREVGSADYLDAYWRGRHFGFITDEQAKADPNEW